MIKIRVAIVDDHPLIINGLKEIVKSCGDIELIAAYAGQKELLNGLKDQQPDILLLDLHMPAGSGEELVPVLTARYKSMKIIALTNQDNSYYVKSIIGNGAAGYVLKTSGAEIILQAIRLVARKQSFIDPVLKEKLLQESLHATNANMLPQLTRREKEVLELLASNFNSQEIADQLFLSKRTIDNHRLSLLLKLGVKNSAALIKKAMQLRLIN